MADIITPLTAGEMKVQQDAIDRQRKIAEYLQQQSLTPDQGQMVSGHYVKPSATQYLAKLAQGLLGRSQQSSLDNKQMALATQQGDALRGQFGVGGNGPEKPPAPIQDPPSMPNGSGMSSANTNGIVGTDKLAAALLNNPEQPQAAPQGQPTQQGNGSRLIPGMSPMMAFQLYNSDPKTYDTAFLKQFEPTELQRNDKYLGINADQSRASEIASRAAKGAVVNRGFGILTTNPLTGKLENDPESLKGIEKAKEIEGRFGAPVSLDSPDGSKVQLSPTEFAEFQKNGGKLPMRFLPQETQAGIQKEADTSGASGDINIKTPQGTVSGHVSPQGSVIGKSQSTFNQALDKDEAGRVSKMKEDIYDKGTHAIDKVVQNNKMIELLPSVTTGPLNKQITMIKNIGESLGVNIGDPAPNQEFEKYAIQGALSAAKQIYGARITNMDVTTQIASNPGSSMTEKAIYQLLKYDNEIQQRHIQKMTALGEYQRGGGDPREFQVYFSQKYPFQGIGAPKSGNTENFTIDTPSLTPNAVAPKNDLYQQFSLKPKK